MYSEKSEEEKENFIQRLIGKIGYTHFYISLPILIIIVCSIICFSKVYNFSKTSKHVHFSNELIINNI